MPAPLYARYVPPKPGGTVKPSKAQKVGSPAATAVPNDSKHNDSNEEHSKRSKDQDYNEEHDVWKHHQKKEKRKRETDDQVMSDKDKLRKKDSKRKRAKIDHDAPPPRDVDGLGGGEDAVKDDGVEDEHEQELVRRHKSVLSKFQRSTERSRALASIAASQQTVPSEDEKAEPVELHGLEPIPQPTQPEPAPYEPTFSALPSWLAKPIHIPSSAKSKFSDLHISERTAQRLASQNIHEAFAVQTGVLPLLFPGPDAHNGDLLVSAATGSGKTLAYMLPLIESIANAKGGSGLSKLRAVVVVPTRELVNQARETAEMCAGGLGLSIGIALGSRALQMEQSQLVRTIWKWDPAERKRILQRATDKLRNAGLVDVEAEAVADALPGHVPAYESAVDILICTPGRLVEHLRNTKGFNMIDCEWLVIDEADRLLDESFQEWVETVTSALDTSPDESDSLEQLRASVSFPPPRKRVRKVVLSATMTRDLNKLGSLRLSRPKLVVVQGKGVLGDGEGGPQDSTTFELPQGLSEYAIPVGDGSEKPLFLLTLLQSRILRGVDLASKPRKVKASSRSAPSTDSSSESDTDSDSESSISTDSSSSDDSSSESGSELSSGSESSTMEVPGPTAPDEKVSIASSDSSFAPSVLIFVSSTESAARLSHLISGLSPSLASHITTLTKSTRDPATRKMLHQLRVSLTKSKTSAKRTPTLIISTDLTSRGLDLPLTHVINYDIPTSLSSYIHRTGRTARAGRTGEAWTLFQSREGRWFWGDVARATNVSRDAKVKRIEMKLESEVEDVELLRKKYMKVLEDMKKIVAGK